MLQRNRAGAKNGAVYGPLIPSVGGQAFIGGLGGGKDSQTGNFGESEEYMALLNWRIGPGGLFVFSEIHVQQARLRATQLSEQKLRDEIAQQVVTARARARVLSLAHQLATARLPLSDARENLRLDQERKEFGVGIVLETIVAEQELTGASTDYLRIVADYNKVQYDLLRALGRISTDLSASRVTRSR